MSDRTSKVFDGITKDLLATYASGVENATGGYNCEEYERINVYVGTSDVLSSGIVSVYVDFSHDNSTFYVPMIVDPSTGLATAVNQKTATTAGNFMFSFPNAGKFFRVRIKYAAGVSVVVTGVAVEAKS